MRVLFPFLLVPLTVTVTLGQDLAKANLLEREGDMLAARQEYERGVQRSPKDASILSAYAQFLDRHRDPGARAAYEAVLKANPGNEAAAKRLIILDLLDGDHAAAQSHFAAYRSAGGQGLTAPPAPASAPADRQDSIKIPGPIRSFARMAALSPDLRPTDLLTALARNVITNGYQATSSSETLDQTEYLKLVFRYLSQARELQALAEPAAGYIKLEGCESAGTADLLRILGYRMRGGCGSDVVLETVNATRAFLTIDSGFPLAELEQALRTNRPFEYDFRPTEVPVLYGTEYWLQGSNKEIEKFVDMFLSDPSLCRLYLGMAKLDPDTAAAVRKQMPATKLRAFAHVLDFYGGMFQLKNGAAIVPGGERAWSAWSELVGESPKNGPVFLERLLIRDDGWLASYYDAIARISGPKQAYLLETKRLQRFYGGLRGKVTSPGPARPVFRASTDLMLLAQRLRIEADGKPHIPGGLEMWKNLFINHPHGKYDGKLTKAASGWKDPDDLIEALFALSRKAVENEPLKIFLALTDLNRNRPQPLDTTTADRLAREWRDFGAQYSIFAEVPSLTGETMVKYLDAAKRISDGGNHLERADRIGSFQALVGLWQVFCRQGSIPAGKADGALSNLIDTFAEARDPQQVFDAARKGTQIVLAAAGVPEAAAPHDAMVDLVAGTATVTDSAVHQQVVESVLRVLEAQRLLPLDTLFLLADNLEKVSKGERLDTGLVAKLAARVSEIQLPRASLSSAEKNSMAFGYWIDKHVDAERRTNLRAAIDKAKNNPERLLELRGLLAPFVRDTLLGYLYAHYAPPGAQILVTNPLFVRSHDFLGIQGSAQTWRQTEVYGTGWPSSAGGRLVGSVAGLPYALAEAEQNFLIPSREQALIWGDLVPQMLVAAKVPRWWNVKPAQLYWVALHLNQGETLLAESALNDARREELLNLLSVHAAPARVSRVARLLEARRVRDAVEQVTPSELYLVARDWWAEHADDQGLLTAEVRRLKTQAGSDVSAAAISRAFGTPKPTLANSYRPELLGVRTFPTLMGYSSRIMAESWESNMLYFAALADQVHMPPSQLNVAIPEWTQRTVENIFATHLEDWPALLRSLRMVGEDVATKARQSLAAERQALLQ